MYRVYMYYNVLATTDAPVNKYPCLCMHTRGNYGLVIRTPQLACAVRVTVFVCVCVCVCMCVCVRVCVCVCV